MPQPQIAEVIDLVNVDEDTAESSDEDDIPLAQIQSQSSRALSSSRTSSLKPPSAPKRAGKPTKDEKLDMAVYIFGKGPNARMDRPEAWAEFRKLKDVCVSDRRPKWPNRC